MANVGKVKELIHGMSESDLMSVRDELNRLIHLSHSIIFVKEPKKNKFMYRVRGINPYTHRESFVTNCYDRTLTDAQLTLRTTDSRWKNLRIVKFSRDEYMRKHQNIPRFC